MTKAVVLREAEARRSSVRPEITLDSDQCAGASGAARVPDGSFTASGNGGQRLTVIPQIETLVVNLMNIDEPGPRVGTADD